MKVDVPTGWYSPSNNNYGLYIHETKIWRDSDKYPLLLVSASRSASGKGLRYATAIVFDHEATDWDFITRTDVLSSRWDEVGRIRNYPGRDGLLRCHLIRRQYGVKQSDWYSRERADLVMSEDNREKLVDLMMLTTEVMYST